MFRLYLRGTTFKFSKNQFFGFFFLHLFLDFLCNSVIFSKIPQQYAGTFIKKSTLFLELNYLWIMSVI